MTSILYLMLKSPHEYSDLSIMGRIAGEAPCSVVLLNDAVLHVCNQESAEKLHSWVDEVYAMKDDIEARGLPVQGNVNIIEYADLVDLVMEGFDQTITI